MREGGFYSRENDNPFKDFVKVYQPYCTSDIHQGTDSYTALLEINKFFVSEDSNVEILQ